MKRLVVVCGILLVAGLGWWAFAPSHQPQDIEPAAGGAAQGEPMKVTVRTLAVQEVQPWHEFSGKLVAVERVDVRPRVGGAIQEIYFTPGAIVEKGQKLFLIDPRPYSAAVNQAAAAVATARAQASLANTEAERAERLIKDNAISQREFASRTNASKVAQANIQSAEAALQQAKLNLEYATITAPVKGKISRAEITVGNLVDPAGGQVLAEIVSMDPIFADFELDEKTYLQNVRQAAANEEDATIPVELSLKDDNGVIYTGKIVSFDNKLDTTSGTIRARAIFDNADKILVPGMFATIHIGSADRISGILVNDKYVNTDQDKKFVYVVEENKVAYRPVILGGSIKGERLVVDGLKEGDRVIVKGLQRLRPGIPVQAIEEGAETAAAPVPAGAEPMAKPEQPAEQSAEPQEQTE